MSAALKETLERVSMLGAGITRYVSFKTSEASEFRDAFEQQHKSLIGSEAAAEVATKSETHIERPISDPLDNGRAAEPRARVLPTKFASVKEKIETIATSGDSIPKIELSNKDKELLRKLEMEHEEKIKRQNSERSMKAEEISDVKSSTDDGKSESSTQTRPKIPTVRPRQSVSLNYNWMKKFVIFNNRIILTAFSKCETTKGTIYEITACCQFWYTGLGPGNRHSGGVHATHLRIQGADCIHVLGQYVPHKSKHGENRLYLVQSQRFVQTIKINFIPLVYKK